MEVNIEFLLLMVMFNFMFRIGDIRGDINIVLIIMAGEFRLSLREVIIIE